MYQEKTHLYAPLAQLDRVAGFEPVGREFESLRVRHSYNKISRHFLKAEFENISSQIHL